MTDRIKVILFDLGGVLVEVTGVSAIQAWTELEVTAETIWDKWLASPAVRAFETGRIGQDEFARQLIREMPLPVTTTEFLESFTLWPRGLYAGAEELLNSIPGTYTLAALSNSNSLHWPRMLNEVGLAGKFDLLFASHLIGKIKPDVEIFEHVLKELDCDPATILYVDDNQPNVDTGRSLGMQAERTKGIAELEKVLRAYQII